MYIRPLQPELRTSYDAIGKILDGTPVYPTNPEVNSTSRNRTLIAGMPQGDTLEALFCEFPPYNAPHDYTERRLLFTVQRKGDAPGTTEQLYLRELSGGIVTTNYYFFAPQSRRRSVSSFLGVAVTVAEKALLNEPPDEEPCETAPEYITLAAYDIAYRTPPTELPFDPESEEGSHVFARERALYFARLLGQFANARYKPAAG